MSKRILSLFVLLVATTCCRTVSPVTPEAVYTTKNLAQVAREAQLDPIERRLADFARVKLISEALVKETNALTLEDNEDNRNRLKSIKAGLDNLVVVATPSKAEQEMVPEMDTTLRYIEEILELVYEDVKQQEAINELLRRTLDKVQGKESEQSGP